MTRQGPGRVPCRGGIRCVTTCLGGLWDGGLWGCQCRRKAGSSSECGSAGGWSRARGRTAGVAGASPAGPRLSPSRSLLLPIRRRNGCFPCQPEDAASSGTAVPQPQGEHGPPGAQPPRGDACSRAGSAPSALEPFLATARAQGTTASTDTRPGHGLVHVLCSAASGWDRPAPGWGSELRLRVKTPFVPASLSLQQGCHKPAVGH